VYVHRWSIRLNGNFKYESTAQHIKTKTHPESKLTFSDPNCWG